MTSGYKRIESVKTALAVLEHLSNRKDPIQARELGIALKLPYGTVMTHVATLEDLGYVANEGGGIRIGPKVAMFWFKQMERVEAKRTTIEQALAVLEGY